MYLCKQNYYLMNSPDLSGNGLVAFGRYLDCNISIDLKQIGIFKKKKKVR